MQLAIFGSCVSRDTLNFLGPSDPIRLALYIARCAVGSLDGKPVEDTAVLDGIASAFQRSMVERDLKKLALPQLQSAAYDTLLLDFIDDRLDLLVRPDRQTIVTLSKEYVKHGGAMEGRRVHWGSSDHWHFWDRGITSLVRMLDSRRERPRVLINEAYWASITSDGSPVPGFTQRQIVEANEFLREAYRRAYHLLPQSIPITYQPDHLVSDRLHRWGPAPFHYVPSFYRHQISAILGTADNRAMSEPDSL